MVTKEDARFLVVLFEKLKPLKRFKDLGATADDIKEAAQSSVRLKVWIWVQKAGRKGLIMQNR